MQKAQYKLKKTFILPPCPNCRMPMIPNGQEIFESYQIGFECTNEDCSDAGMVYFMTPTIIEFV